MIMGGWIIINLEALLLVREHNSRQRFSIGLLMALSSLVLSSAILLEDYSTLPDVDKVIYWCQFAPGLCVAIASCSLHRRPDVSFENSIVDGQYTCSAIQRLVLALRSRWSTTKDSRYTFAWVRPLLDQARKLRPIEYDDLPVLDHTTRSNNLEARFPVQEAQRRPLWRLIIRDHYSTIVQQWLVATIESVVSILPPLCMFKILSLLEKRSLEHSTDNSAIWMWSLGLANSKIVHVGLSNWLQWVSFGLFAIPIRSQLSAVIFAKSLRMKIVEGTDHKKDEKPLADEAAQEEAQETDALLPHVKAVEQEQEPDDKSTHSAAKGILNLLGVDVQRVSDFCGYNQDLLRGALKVTVTALLLITLVGWQSTLAGFAVPVIFQPLNNIATKHYTSRQLKVMAARDDKAHVVEEALVGIRQIKFSATEKQWEERILAVREQELKAQWGVYVWTIFITFCWIAMPALIGATALSVYALTSEQMLPSVAFTALSIFSSLEWTISTIPITITEMLDARVSANRIQEHLNSDERLGTSKAGAAIAFDNASITWPSNSRSSKNFTLRNLSLQFPNNRLSIIEGKTGTGKSLLLSAIIGEADIIAGDIRVPQALPMNKRDNEHASTDNWIISDALAYVGQVPWIENASVRDTILYGLPYHHDRYTQVIHACSLAEDISMLPDGEDTEVGATGINLSGGQRWRLTFARALYSRAGVLVLDDIFSAVDSHVGRHLLDHAILGPLGENRTKILVTHHVGLVKRYAAYVVTLDGDGTASGKHDTSDEPISQPPRLTDPSMLPEAKLASTPSEEEPLPSDTPKIKARKFVEDEERQQGRVKWQVYETYLKASGGFLYWTMTFAIFTLAAFSTVARSYWLAIWTETYNTTEGPEQNNHDHATSMSSSQPNLVFYLGIYILISMVSVALVGVKIILVLTASLRAARKLFETVTSNVLRAQLRWLDTQPIGRTLNRFVGDFALIDSRLGGDLQWSVNGIFSIMSIMAAALIVSLWMIAPVFILSILCISIVYLYLDAARDIKRLESNAKSPIFELVGSTLSGLATIRSFGRIDDYIVRMNSHIDRYAQSSWYILLAGQWMKVRQGVLGVFFTLCIAVGVACLPTIDASLAGFALSFALDFSEVIKGTISRYTEAELDMNSTERVLEYTRLKTEPTSGAEAQQSWPSEGKIEVQDLEVSYAHDLDPVLKGISFSVKSCERVGIVGRTGSGKSSLTLALFRFLEARQGSVEIDGVDIKTLKLHDVRSRLAIIPQDPALFSGTLRSNLDPFNEHSDMALLEALKRVSPVSHPDMPARHANIFTDLSSPVTRGGANLSQGEKQLVCLARAILSRPRIMVLDEATSAVDMATDTMIQRSIRKEFRNSTLLVVAHRLSTVADFDKILVMSDGRVAEFDEPKVLAKRKGLFWNMLNESGEKDALEDLLA
ncbi:hypothetical protein AAFC00_001898 [Neodothiora populina]|uniref:ATP-dependent bile acid permease n=1 Tax=Neodothiora populina TaxID=2781224 RepID=A0ABR3PQL3_9PEZI